MDGCSATIKPNRCISQNQVAHLSERRRKSSIRLSTVSLIILTLWVSAADVHAATQADGATLTVSLNAGSFLPGQTMVVTAKLTPSITATMVDAYVVVQLPSGVFLSLQLGGRLVPGIVPIARGFAPFPYEAVLVQYTFSGVEPTGAYTWYSGLSRPGTLEFVTPLQQAVFTFDTSTLPTAYLYSKVTLLASVWKNFQHPEGGGTFSVYSPPFERTGRMNNLGQWLGTSYPVALEAQPDRPTFAAVLDETGVRFPFGTTEPTTPIDINDAGAVLGAEWRSGEFETVHTLLESPSGVVTRFRLQYGAGLNNLGDVLLQDFVDTPLPRARIRYSNGTVRELTDVFASAGMTTFGLFDLNDRGDVVGVAPGGGGWDVFALWQGAATPMVLWHVPTTPRVLTGGVVIQVPSVSSVRVNNRGLVHITLLHSEPSGPAYRYWSHDFIWNAGQLIDIAPNSEATWMSDVNDNGEAIVRDAEGEVLYRNGQRISLAALRTPPPGGGTAFQGITDRGQIYGTDAHSSHIFYCMFDDPSGCFRNLFRWDPKP
jgi:hypothetical protein